MQKKDMVVGKHYAYGTRYSKPSRVLLLEPSGQYHNLSWETEFGKIESRSRYFDRKDPVILILEPDGSDYRRTKSWRDETEYPHVIAVPSKDLIAEWDEYNNVILPKKEAARIEAERVEREAKARVRDEDQRLYHVAASVNAIIHTNSSVYGRPDSYRTATSVTMGVGDFERLVALALKGAGVS